MTPQPKMPPTQQPNNEPIVPTPPATTLSLEQSSQLMNNPAFRGRVKIAAMKFALLILQGAGQSQARLKWAQNTIGNPELSGANAMGVVTVQSQVQTAGSEITDEQLDAATVGGISLTF